MLEICFFVISVVLLDRLTLKVGQVCCWFLSFSQGFFGFSGFPPFLNTDICKIQFAQNRGPIRKPALADGAFSLNIAKCETTLHT